MGRDCGLDSKICPFQDKAQYRIIMPMRSLRRWTIRALRTVLVLALCLQSITNIAMLFNMASAQAAPVSAEFIVICTPEGLKKVPWSDIDDQQPQTQHSCICACGVLCSTCSVALPQSQLRPDNYPDLTHLMLSDWQYDHDAPQALQGFNAGKPRAPPA